MVTYTPNHYKHLSQKAYTFIIYLPLMNRRMTTTIMTIHKETTMTTRL